MVSLDDMLKSPDGTRKTGIYPVSFAIIFQAIHIMGGIQLLIFLADSNGSSVVFCPRSFFLCMCL